MPAVPLLRVAKSKSLSGGLSGAQNSIFLCFDDRDVWFVLTNMNQVFNVVQ